MVGDVGVGGKNPIRVQSMTISDTMDTLATVNEAIALYEAGCEIVRITAPGKKDAENLGLIKAGLSERGYSFPLVADIHFAPAAAMIAVEHADKVRINPGNFVDRKKFKVVEYTDEAYQEELERVHETFKPLVLRAKELGRSMRIGSNHGSLSDRIMNRFGDTPEGMVESAIEFIEVARLYDYHDIIVSMKASNPTVMVQAYRMLVERFRQMDMDYPLHLGVTEAGDGKDGRIKSTIGIASLLEDGIGDTIRVSLTEDSIHELPVARRIAERYNRRLAGENSTNGNFVYPEYNKSYFSFLSPYEQKRTTPSGWRGGVLPAPKNKAARVALLSVLDTFDSTDLSADLAEQSAELKQLAEKGCDAFLLKAGALSNRDFAQSNLKKLENFSRELAGQNIKAALYAHFEGSGSVAPSDFRLPAGFRGVSLDLQASEFDPEATGELLVKLKLNSSEILINFILPENRATDTNFDKSIIDSFDALAARIPGGFTTSLAFQAGEFATMRTPADLVGYYRLLACHIHRAERQEEFPILIQGQFRDKTDALYGAALQAGSLLLDGIGDGLRIDYNDKNGAAGNALERLELGLDILQSCRLRMVRTEFISCPSCGRTLFDLQDTTARIKARTGHLKGVKIAIMGCIVNGPGEMADADFGYVGAGPGKVHLYREKEIIKANVNSEVADDELVALIKEHDMWRDP